MQKVGSFNNDDFGRVTTEMTSLFTNFFPIIPARSKYQIRWICGQLNSRGPHPSFEGERKIHRFIHKVLHKTLHEGIHRRRSFEYSCSAGKEMSEMYQKV